MLSNKDKAIKYGVKRPNIVKNFYKHLNHLEDGCIEWVGSKNEHGYGFLGIGFGNKCIAVKAHRFAYALEHGFDALPRGGVNKSNTFIINHLCMKRDCVNHEHLESITFKKNLSKEKRIRNV
jgi:hypothetical protein